MSDANVDTARGFDEKFSTLLKEARVKGGKSPQRQKAFDLLDRHYADVSLVLEGSSRAGFPTVAVLIVEAGGPKISVRTLRAAWEDLKEYRAEIARAAYEKSKAQGKDGKR